ncbi:MAG: hydrogen gas-evolving membrane-bound hydrogenase subunit E [Planctomycetota bacterium]
MIAALVALLLTGLLAPALDRLAGRFAGLVAAVVPAAGAWVFGAALFADFELSPVALPWAPRLGLELALRADGLALLFAFLITGIGALVSVYAGSYLAEQAARGRFLLWLYAFMFAMLGLVLADNLLLVFVFWELTSFSSFMLIGFGHERGAARAAAQQALLITAGGGLALLMGLLLLGGIAGGMELGSILAAGDTLRAHPWYAPATLLVLIGCFTKSAQWPFHFWLPDAMEAPTPASAYLHSATMVKAGIYLLARLQPALGGTALWQIVVGATGTVTLLVGGWLALAETDLKRLLAYSTVSALGAMTLFLGLSGGLAVTAAVALVVAHACYKGALFLVAGAVDHGSGTRDIRELGGLRRALPWTAVAAILAGISMAGLPPLFGFIAKEAALAGAMELGWWLIAAIVLFGAFAVFVAIQVALRPFFGAARASLASAHEVPVAMLAGPLLLALAGLALGLAPMVLAEPLIGPAATAIAGTVIAPKLVLWHGFDAALGLSALSLVLGLLLSFASVHVRRLVAATTLPIGPTRCYGLVLAGTLGTAKQVTNLIQNGRLRFYLISILLVLVALVLYALQSAQSRPLPAFSLPPVHHLLLALLLVSAAAAVALFEARLLAIAAIGVVGLLVSLIFVLHGAPDLAITQLAIDALSVVLLVFAFRHLPDYRRVSSVRRRLVDTAIALGVGTTVTLLVLLALGVRPIAPISDWYSEQAVPGGHGRNVVNVILVDFRSLDTLGEIVVLAVAAIGVHALVRSLHRPGTGNGGGQA